MAPLRLPLLLLFLTFALTAFAQQPDLTPWTNNTYGNEWIDYTKTYVRVGITEDGFYKIPLATLQSRVPGLTADNVQGWFRGQQIALRIDGSDVIFYGRRNDGASDGLMYRNSAGNQIDPGERLNIYDSFYSEQGAHFFTAAKEGEVKKRMILTHSAPVGDVTSEPYHIETLMYSTGRTYRTDSEPTRRGVSEFAFRSKAEISIENQSYYVRVNAFYDLGGNILPKTISLSNRVSDAADPITLIFAGHGDGTGSRTIVARVAPTQPELSNSASIVHELSLSSFNGSRVQTTIPATRIGADGNAAIQFETRKPSADASNNGGVSFFTVSFAQTLDMAGESSKKFYFKEGISGKRRIDIAGADATTVFYDITNPYEPKLINGTLTGTVFSFDADRVSNSPLVIQGVKTAGHKSPNSSFIFDVPFTLLYNSEGPGRVPNGQIDPSGFDYLIITHPDYDEYQISQAAIQYGEYRASQEGGRHRVLVITTRSIYDQFNFGEPSPIAIGRFVNYMIQAGVRKEHYVLLMGHGVGNPVRLMKELPGDIPTYGNPGSDILLVSGLSNANPSHIDIPAVPIGRVLAFNNTHGLNYLNKVKQYESQTASGVDLGWRKKIISLLGLKLKTEEVNPSDPSGQTTFPYYVTQAENNIDQSTGPWTVERISNQNHPNWASHTSGDFPRDDAPIDSKIDEGVGMIGYYGHGNFNGTIYDIGTPKDRYSQASGRYPFLYITGCGVGDVYESHASNPNTRVIANDWINTENKGAIAILANTFLAYTTPAARYMRMLYANIFKYNDSQRLPIGRIQVEMAKQFLGIGANARTAAAAYETSHTHQTALFGDPAIRILVTSDTPLPVYYISFTGQLTENNAVRLDWETAAEFNNEKFVIERSFDGKVFEEIGSVDAIKVNNNEGGSYRFTDLTPRKGVNYYRLKQFDMASGGSPQQFSYSSIISVDVKATAVMDEISVYPVPSRDLLNISLAASGSSVKNWRLIDNLGRVILSGNEQTVNLKNLSTGSFLLEVTNSENQVFRKRIVKH